MGGGDAPEPTDPRLVIREQGKANTTALQQSQAANQVNQVNPGGSQGYNLLGYDQYGNPQYGLAQQYNPQNQALQNMMLGSRSIGGFQGNTLLNNLSTSGNYDQAFDPSQKVGDITSGRLGQMTGFMDPFFTKQFEDQDNRLRNQGLMPGNPAYDREMHAMRTTQQLGLQDMLAKFQPEAQRQVMSEHIQPIEEAMTWSKFGNPDPLTFANTPQYAQNAVNAGQIYGNYDQAKMAQWQANQAAGSGLWQGIGGIAGSILGGPVGGAIGGGLSSMFGPAGSLT